MIYQKGDTENSSDKIMYHTFLYYIGLDWKKSYSHFEFKCMYYKLNFFILLFRFENNSISIQILLAVKCFCHSSS